MAAVYVKDDKSVLADTCGRFIYEVYVFVMYENTFSTANHKYFSSDIEILNIIESYYVTPNIEINCTMYSAPLSWLIENDYVLWVKPVKKKRITKPKNEQKTKIN